MSVFEYIAVLISIVIGLGITQVLSGVAGMIQHPDQRKPYWVHLLWGLFCFLALIFFWWWEFALVDVGTWTFAFYLFVVVYAVLFYVLCSILFPRDIGEYADYRSYFYSRRRWFFGVLATLFLVDVIDTLLKGVEYFENLGCEYLSRAGVYVVLSLVAMRTRSEKFHATFAVFALCYYAYFIFRNYDSISYPAV